VRAGRLGYEEPERENLEPASNRNWTNATAVLGSPTKGGIGKNDALRKSGKTSNVSSNKLAGPKMENSLPPSKNALNRRQLSTVRCRLEYKQIDRVNCNKEKKKNNKGWAITAKRVNVLCSWRGAI